MSWFVPVVPVSLLIMVTFTFKGGLVWIMSYVVMSVKDLFCGCCCYFQGWGEASEHKLNPVAQCVMRAKEHFVEDN